MPITVATRQRFQLRQTMSRRARAYLKRPRTIRRHHPAQTRVRTNARNMGFTGFTKNVQFMRQRAQKQKQPRKRLFRDRQRLREARRKKAIAPPKIEEKQRESSIRPLIGAPLSKPLEPNRNGFDLFDKNLRKEMVQRYIFEHGGGQLLPFNDRLLPIFAISIRPERFDRLVRNMGPWGKLVTYWAGTVGALLNPQELVKNGNHFKRGQVGCYESHVGIWRHMCNHHIPHALILEDDADIHYGRNTINRLNKMFIDLDRHKVDYDVIYIIHNESYKPKMMIPGTEIGVPGSTQCLMGYYVTLQGARKLFERAYPMTRAVDDYVFLEGPRVRQYSLEPRLSWIFDEHSDTNVA